MENFGENGAYLIRWRMSMLGTINSVLAVAISALSIGLRLHPPPPMGEQQKRPLLVRVLIWVVFLGLAVGLVVCSLVQQQRQAEGAGEVKALSALIEKQTDKISALQQENRSSFAAIQSISFHRSWLHAFSVSTFCGNRSTRADAC